MRLIDADALKGCACTVMKVGVADTYAPRSTFSAVPVRFIDEQPTVEVPRWIPVTERLPEDDYVPGDKTIRIKVIVCNVNNGPRSIRTLTRCWDRWLSIDGNVREWKWRWTWSKNVRDNEITHWMPLFELPKVVE